MFEKIRTIFTIPELRQKVLLTLFLLAIYRVGWQVPLPIVNTAEMKRVSEQGAGQGGLQDVFNQVAIFSASQLNVVTIFGLGIMPYISASIIFQLLGSVWEPLEKLRKEGESGQKKINEYTRYLTVFICLIQTWGYVKYYLLGNNGRLLDPNFYDPVTQTVPFGWIVVTILTMTAGTIFLMWLGEQIDEFGIGNGISLLIMAGILARMPAAASEMLGQTQLELGSGNGKKGIEVLIGLVLLFVGVVAGVVYIDRAQRRIPTQHAKHVRGRRVFGGTRRISPAESRSIRRHADHLRQQLAAFSADDLQVGGGCDRGHQWSTIRLAWHLGEFGAVAGARQLLHLQRAVYRADLLLLLFLDGDHLQPEGDGRQHEGPWHVHTRLSSGRPHGRSLGARHGAHHLCRRRLSGGRGHHADDHRQPDGRAAECVELFRRHWAVDHRQRRVRSGSADRQSPDHAEL